MIVRRHATRQSGGPKGPRYLFLSALARGPRGQRTRQVEDAIRGAIVSLALLPGEFIRTSAIRARLATRDDFEAFESQCACSKRKLLRGWITVLLAPDASVVPYD